MKIILTGGAGFIGANFAIQALKQGHAVINIDALTYAGNLDNLEYYKNHPQHHFYHESICDKSKVQTIFQRHAPDTIVHMAAESHVDRSIDCADPFIETNIMGTHTLLAVGLKYYQSLPKPNNFRFIHLSTDEVFGALGQTGRFNEFSSYRPNSPYAASKASSDLIVRSYNKTYGLPTIIVNSSNNYGPKQFPEKLIPLTILNALELRPLPVYGDGQQIRDWIHVEDHVRALDLLMTKGATGESYCIGSDNEITNLDLVKKICLILDNIKPRSDSKSYADLITFVTDRPGHDYRYATNASKLKDMIDWYPKISFDEGLRRTIEWYLPNASKNDYSRLRIGLRDKDEN